MHGRVLIPSEVFADDAVAARGEDEELSDRHDKDRHHTQLLGTHIVNLVRTSIYFC